MSDSFWLHGLQHARLPCPTPTPGAQVSDAIQPSHPLLSPSPPAFNLSQHQGLWWVGCLHQVAKVLELQLQHQSFQWIPRTDLLAKIKKIDILIYNEILHFHCFRACESTLWSYSFHFIEERNKGERHFKILISFRSDWFDFLVVQGTLKSLLQHRISKASVLSFPYGPHIHAWLLGEKNIWLDGLLSAK